MLICLNIIIQYIFLLKEIYDIISHKTVYDPPLFIRLVTSLLQYYIFYDDRNNNNNNIILSINLIQKYSVTTKYPLYE